MKIEDLVAEIAQLSNNLGMDEVMNMEVDFCITNGPLLSVEKGKILINFKSDTILPQCG